MTSPPMRKPAITPPPLAAKPAGKAFAVKPYSVDGMGRKTLLYGASGIGKNTLASMIPNVVFIGVDYGGLKICNPKTQEPVKAVVGVETFQDVRDAVRSPGLLSPGDTLCIDNITLVQKLAEVEVFKQFKKDGQIVADLEAYGWGRGYRYLYEIMVLLLPDLDSLARRGVGVLLLAQESQHGVPNLSGIDFNRWGPGLDGHGAKNGPTTLGSYVEWSDYVLRVAFSDPNVRLENPQAKKGKASGGYERIIYTSGDHHFLAKSRTNIALPQVVGFSEPSDDTIWRGIDDPTIFLST